MPFLSTALMTASKPILFVPILVFLLVILFHDSVVDADFTTTNIGAIINVNSRVGKEQNIAMKIAVQNFNNKSSLNHKLSLYFHNLSGDPLQAAYAARELIKEKHVQAIVGTDTWAEAALVANIGSQAQVPLISFASSTIKTRQQPFLMQMVTDISEQLNCVASIVHSLTWRKVIVVYEEDISGGDFGMLALLSDALQNVGSDIEYHLVFPPFSSLSDPKKFVHEELKKFMSSTQSRAFIVLHTSFSLTTLLFQEAKKMKLMGKDSAWVITDTIASFLDSANSSILSSMEGVLGIKTDYSQNTKSFLDFYDQFRVSFGLEYPEDENYKPGIHALRAYDSIQTIARAMERSLITNTSTTTSLLKNILSSNFNGLSGEIHFEEGRLSYRPTYQLINVVNKSYNNLGFWSPEFGFSKSPKFEDKNCGSCDFMKLLDHLMSWPGNSNQVPKGWKMPTLEEPLRIGVPGMAAFDNFVRRNSSNKTDGFCVSVFEEVHRILQKTYDLPYEFVEFDGTYDDLVANVANKTFDAAVGDITILAKRWKGVEFTQPFTESGLSMVVPSKPAPKAWIFLEPFTWGMWLATGAILIYTMFIVWFLEHRSNPEFSGSWKDQLGNALWFTCSSLFLAHREKIQSNYTRVVVVVWLFVALVLTQSYTASLTSMLTISRLQPNFEYMKRSNATVGCDNNTFMRQYAEDVLGYNSDNVKNISDQQNYLMAFKNGSISAALLEIPYAKVFVNNHYGEYTITGSSYRFGGFGFVFQKGSPIAADVSEAILKLSENGKLKVLEEKWLTITPLSSDCSDSQTNQNMDSLSIESFWGLFLISVATSSVCLVLFVARLLKNYRLHQQSRARVSDASDESVWIRTVRLAQYLNNAETTSGNPRSAPISIQLARVEETRSCIRNEETNNGNVSASREDGVDYSSRDLNYNGPGLMLSNVGPATELGKVRLEVVLNHGAFLTTMEGNEAQPRLQEVEMVALDSEEINSWKGSTNDNLEEIVQDTSLPKKQALRQDIPPPDKG